MGRRRGRSRHPVFPFKAKIPGEGDPTNGWWLWWEGDVMAASAYAVQIGPGQSVQTAYNSLPAGGGIIYLTPGRYDIVNGVTLQRDKPAAFIGTERWRRHIVGADVPLDATHTPGPVLYSSTATANWFFSMPSPASPSNAQGFVWKALTAEMGPSAGFVQGDNLCDSIIEDCAVYSTNAAAWLLQLNVRDALSLGTSHGDDASWNRIIKNDVNGCGLFSTIGAGASTTFRFAVGTPYYQHNQNVTAYNSQTGGNNGISLYGSHRTPLIGNTFENVGSPVIKMEMTSQCSSIGNGGTGTAAYFAEINRSSGNYLADTGLATPGTGKLYLFTNGSKHNLAIAPGLSTAADANLPLSYTQDAAKITDDDGTKPNYYIRPGFYHLGTAE